MIHVATMIQATVMRSRSRITGSLGGYYANDPYKLPRPASCLPRPNCCFFRPIFSCGLADHHPSKPRLAGSRGRVSTRVRQIGCSLREFFLEVVRVDCEHRSPRREPPPLARFGADIIRLALLVAVAFCDRRQDFEF